MGISRGTFNKWVSENIIKVAGRLKSTQEKPLGERRFDLDHILELKKEMYPNKK